MERILLKFQDSLRGELQQLDQAYDAQDETTVATIAHRMKGTSLTVSANRLAESAQQLQEMALSNFSAIDEDLLGLRKEIAELSELLTSQLRGAS